MVNANSAIRNSVNLHTTVYYLGIAILWRFLCFNWNCINYLVLSWKLYVFIICYLICPQNPNNFWDVALLKRCHNTIAVVAKYTKNYWTKTIIYSKLQLESVKVKLKMSKSTFKKMPVFYWRYLDKVADFIVGKAASKSEYWIYILLYNEVIMFVLLLCDIIK